MRKSLHDRVWSKVVVDSPGECWLTTVRGNTDGRPQIGVNGKLVLMSHLIYEWTYGPIPAGARVLHTCDNPRCVNPKHLWLGTQVDNMKDRSRKGRNNSSHGETHYAAKLTTEQVKEIRRRYREEHLFQKELADIYGVCQAHISRIVRGDDWKSVH